MLGRQERVGPSVSFSLVQPEKEGYLPSKQLLKKERSSCTKLSNLSLAEVMVTL